MNDSERSLDPVTRAASALGRGRPGLTKAWSVSSPNMTNMDMEVDILERIRDLEGQIAAQQVSLNNLEHWRHCISCIRTQFAPSSSRSRSLVLLRTSDMRVRAPPPPPPPRARPTWPTSLSTSTSTETWTETETQIKEKIDILIYWIKFNWI